ncbi:hypothetical protein FRC91_12475 [Bradymonadales bacterium TMQ1]|nr:hypothetical protein FRC91_12475 [Bradymonadales bacterium TMQ1]
MRVCDAQAELFGQGGNVAVTEGRKAGESHAGDPFLKGRDVDVREEGGVCKRQVASMAESRCGEGCKVFCAGDLDASHEPLPFKVSQIFNIDFGDDRFGVAGFIERYHARFLKHRQVNRFDCGRTAGDLYLAIHASEVWKFDTVKGDVLGNDPECPINDFSDALEAAKVRIRFDVHASVFCYKGAFNRGVIGFKKLTAGGSGDIRIDVVGRVTVLLIAGLIGFVCPPLRRPRDLL